MASGPGAGFERLWIEPRGQGHALVHIDPDDKRSEITLTDSSLLALVGIVRTAVDRAIAGTPEQEKAGLEPTFAVPVVQARLNTNAYQTAVLLQLEDAFGNLSGFALPPEVSASLAEHLPRYAEQIVRAAAARKTQ